MKVIAALIAALLALPAAAQDGRSLLEQRRDSRLISPRVGAEPPNLRSFARQSEARQREWEGATRSEYQRRLDRDGRAAANAWRRTEAERFDAGERVRANDALRK